MLQALLNKFWCSIYINIFISLQIYTKIGSPASGSSVLAGATNNISTLTQRQLDENGNALSELYANSSSVGVTAAAGATMQINCVSPTAANPGSAGILLTSCGNTVSTSATVTIPPHPTSTTVSTSATITTYATGPSQAKAKAKKKSQQERNTKTVDVESVAGYRGKDPVEELVRYIESSGEGGGSGGTKGGDKKKERKKDKDKHQKLKKSNSLEELRSGAKMEVHELKRTAATTESNAVLMRQKSGATSSGGGKQNKNNSSSTADINKSLEGKNSNTNNRKSDRRSWGNEDLKYLEDQQNSNEILTNIEKVPVATVATPTQANVISNKERKNNKGNSTTMTKEEKENKDKTLERNERNLNNNTITSSHSNVTPNENKSEKAEKTEKVERRKRYDTPPNAVTIIDIVPMESSCPETAEFHVVTKKKKPKKPKAISNAEETSVTFNRTHNFTISQKSSTQQQSVPRYKYYQHESNQQYQQQQQQQQYNNNNNNSAGNFNSSAQQQQQQQQYQQQSNENYNNNNNNNDKSRRKSTSSVPPSEKSDSSDLDSVHSLPIESTKANAAAKESTSQQKTKGGAKPANATTLASKNAPISYADIARTNKEIADAAAAAAINQIIPANNVVEISIVETKNIENLNSHNNMTECPIEEKSNTTIKPQKTKKSQIKQDFPELAATVTYSQSLATQQSNQNATSVTVNNDVSPVSLQNEVLNKSSPTEHNYQNPQILHKSKSVENDTMTSYTSSNNPSSATSYATPLNSNNLDQQYPALEKTVKRHSSANVVTNYTTANQTSVSSATTFNFAAAAKQQIPANSLETNMNCNKNLALTTSTNMNNNTHQQQQQQSGSFTNSVNNISANNSSLAITNTTNSNNNRKSKEKSPPIAAQNNLDSIILKKSKKERQQQLQNQMVDAMSTSQTKQQLSTSTSKKVSRTQLKSSNSLTHTSSSSSTATSSTTATTQQTHPRPAVIILNDDRNSSGCAAENQFTFGDFNEDELKLFEDESVSGNTTNDATDNGFETQDMLLEHHDMHTLQHDPCGGTIKSSMATYFNDSGASCENDVVNNSTPDILLNSSIEASSPNTSFNNSSNHNNNGGISGHHLTSTGNNNQSSDSGIYTDKTKMSSTSLSTTSSSTSSSSSTTKQQTGATAANTQQMSQCSTKSKDNNDNKLNTFLSNTKCTSVHTSMDNLEPPPPPQQLETCNDIETAIIAAAREAAKHQQQQQKAQPHLTQQFKNSNANTSNSSSFSSSSSAATSLPQPYISSNNRNYNEHTTSNTSSSYHQPKYVQSNQTKMTQCDNVADDDDSFVNTPRSRSPSRPRRISIQFIPPTMATAFSTQQHNDIIIDFIGSGKFLFYTRRIIFMYVLMI